MNPHSSMNSVDALFSELAFLRQEVCRSFAICSGPTERGQQAVLQLTTLLEVQPMSRSNDSAIGEVYLKVLEELCSILVQPISSTERSFIIKHTCRPLFQIISSHPHLHSHAVDILMEHMVQIKPDVENTSALLCIASKFFPLNDQLIGHFSYILDYFLATSAHIRRRGAFLLEQPLPHLLKGAPSDGWHQRRPWMVDFLQTYVQIEGASALHLVKQVEPYLVHTFHLASSPPIRPNPPPIVPTLAWARALLNCLLAAQVPSIRKYALQLLFGGNLPLPGSCECIDWLTDDLLPAIDSTLFFPANLSDVDQVDSSIYPGVLFTSFFNEFCSRYSSIREYFLQKLLQRVFLLRSLCAIKWLVQVKVNSRCVSYFLSLEAISSFKNLLRGALLTTNDLVRLQVNSKVFLLAFIMRRYSVDFCL